MPITSSAKKALRQSARRHMRNVSRRKTSKSAVKEVRKLLASKKMDEAKVALPKAFQALDKAAKTGAIKKNTASRLKSRLSLKFTPPTPRTPSST